MDEEIREGSNERPPFKVNRVEERIDISFDIFEASSLYAYIALTWNTLDFRIKRLRQLLLDSKDPSQLKKITEELAMLNQMVVDVKKVQKELGEMVIELDTLKKEVIIKKPNF